MKSLIQKINGIKRKRLYIGVGIFVILGAGLVYARGRSSVVPVAEPTKAKSVSIIDLALVDASAGYGVTASGKVQASQEADLVTETSGVVRSVNVSIGDYVFAGQTLLVLSNSDALAQVAQARAQVASAESAVASAGASQDNSVLALKDAIENAQAKMLEVKETKIAIFFVEPETLSGFGTDITQGNTTYYVGATDRVRREIINNKSQELNTQLEALKEITKNLTKDNIQDAYRGTENALLAMRELQDLMGNEINSYVPANTTEKVVYDIFQSTISAGKSTVNASLTSLRGTSQAYNSATTANNTSSVAIARAGLSLAQAQLNKTILRAPFSGRILSVSPQPGEFIGMGAKAVSILGSSGKEVKASLGASDAQKVSLGARALVEGKYSGTLTKKAPGINPETGKVEIVISLNSNQDITIGEFVSVSIQANNASGSGSIFLPLQAVKATTSGTFVYFVDTDSTARELSVETGDMRGDSIEILSGLQGDERIISSARGVTEGMKVTIRD